MKRSTTIHIEPKHPRADGAQEAVAQVLIAIRRGPRVIVRGGDRNAQAPKGTDA
jgi:hypothetical protein